MTEKQDGTLCLGVFTDGFLWQRCRLSLGHAGNHSAKPLSPPAQPGQGCNTNRPDLSDDAREVAAACYQLAGVAGAPIRILDALSAAANEGTPLPEDFLPLSPDEMKPFPAAEHAEPAQPGQHLIEKLQAIRVCHLANAQTLLDNGKLRAAGVESAMAEGLREAIFAAEHAEPAQGGELCPCLCHRT